MKNNRKLLIAAGLVAAVAASGGAFTAGINTAADASDVVGAGQATVTGATVENIDYTHNGTGLDSVTVTFTGDFTDQTQFNMWLLDGEGIQLATDTQTVVDASTTSTTVVFDFENIDDSTLATTRIAVDGDLNPAI